MKISIIHPTRGRKQMAFETATKWVDRCDNKTNVEYLFSVDTTDLDYWGGDDFKQLFWSRGYLLGCWKALRNDNKSAIEAINNAAKVATGDLIVVVSDDFDCPEHWDTLLLNALKGREDFLVKTQDGIQKTLITLPIMDRKYYERFCYVYEPGYYHMFSDQEMTAVGHMLGKVIDLPLVFPHNHYSVGGMKKDAINAKNDATWIQGQNYFDERLKSNFGLSSEQIVKPYSDIKWR